MDSNPEDLIHISYNISWEPINVYPSAIQTELEKAYHEAHEKKPDIVKLQTWADKFPDVPQFKNYLVTSWSELGDDEKAYAINEKLLEANPDYFFAKINKASFFLQKGAYDKIPEVLGQSMEISLLYPETETFHISEVVGFNKIAILYFLEKENIEAAEARLNMLKKIDPDLEDIEWLSNRIMLKRLETGITRFRKENEAKRKVKYAGHAVMETTASPVFIHPEIEQLYENSMRIDHDIIRSILALPRKTLIEDLEKVVLDSITRFHQFSQQDWDEDKNNFCAHAVFY